MSSSTARPSAIGATSPATRARAPTSRRITAPVGSTPAPSRVPSRSLPRRVPTSASASASASEAATSALGIEYPASAPGEGALGRGLFSTGADPSVPLVIRTPLDVTLCVPEAVDPGASPECAAAVRALYARWSDSLGVAPPDAVVDFLVAAEFPKDLRVAVALMWATRNVPQWRAYKDDVIPRHYESLYLATDDELDALQDENVRRMAVGSRMNYAAGWSALREKRTRRSSPRRRGRRRGRTRDAGGVRLGARHRAHAGDEWRARRGAVRVHRSRRGPRESFVPPERDVRASRRIARASN